MKKIILPFLLIISFSFKSNKTNEIKWNLNNYDKITYDYQQSMTSQNSVVSFSSEPQRSEMSSLLVLNINHDFNEVEVRLENITQKIFTIDSSGTKKLELENELPNTTLTTLKIKPNGEFIYHPKSEIASVLFPNSVRKFKIGDTIQLPFRYSFEFFGEQIGPKGSNTIKNLGNNNFETSIEAETKKELEGTTVKTNLIGNSNFHFSPENGYITENEINFKFTLSNENKDVMDVKSTINYKLLRAE